MDPTKHKRLYLSINITIIAFVLIMDIAATLFATRLQLYYVGVITRMIFGILCIFNGVWNVCTDYYSFLKNNRFNKNRKAPRWAWWIVVVIGVGCIITAFLGYGFNGVTKSTSLEAPTTHASSEYKPTELDLTDSSESNNKNDSQGEVIIKVSYEKPLSLENKNTILIDGLLEGEEYIEIIVKGEIFDFEQIKLIWDESENALKEKEVVKRIEKIVDQTLVIKTYQPEGIPTEKIKWKSRTGKSYEYIICERSSGESDNSIEKYDLN